jgi:hypothetical protein
VSDPQLPGALRDELRAAWHRYLDLRYAFCPETMREVGERLGLRVRTGFYRYPTAAPGRGYTEAPVK